MKLWIFLAIASAVSPLSLAQEAATLSPQSPALLDAEQAMTEHLPAVAIEKLNDFLASTAALDDMARERAESDLTQAMLDSGDATGALERLEFPDGYLEHFWKAEALSALGRWEEAEPIYAAVATDGPADLHEPAVLGQVEALHALDRTAEAIPVLSVLAEHSASAPVKLRLAELYVETRDIPRAKKLLAASKPANLLENRWHRYVEGQILLAEDQAVPAMQAFEELLKDPHGLTASLQAGATVGLTDARIVLNGLEAADNVIEDFIWHNPESPYLEEMFKRLDHIYASEDNPSERELQHWASQDSPRRAALALFYAGRSFQRQGRQEKAIGNYTEFLERFPRHPMAFEAWMQLGQLYLRTGRMPTAEEAFEGAMRSSTEPRQRARAEIASGNAEFAEGEFLVAAETFRNAARRSSDLWLQATYDSALAWLHVGNYDRFLEDYTALSQRFPETDQQRNLLLEEGLLQARSHDPRAVATLQSFIRDFPDNRRVSEARLALAELVYTAGDVNAAGELLQAAYVSQPSDQSKEHADYLAIFIADSKAARKDEKVLELGRRFLDAYPNSPLRSQVRMKMGQVYFRMQDFANAQTQFETLAHESPSDPLADQALILAGQSSVSSMSEGGVEHAQELFARVAQGSGPLKLYARQEQALLYARKGDGKDAALIYDDILRSNPDPQLRFAALCGKADSLVASASGTDAPNSLVTAITLYDQVANDAEAPAHWRDQALYKKAGCLTREGRGADALATLYDILNIRSGPTSQQPDFVWFEKAGYDAAGMLVAQAQWPGAISVLEKVAAAGGPRSDEARKRADELRLEHFVWD